MSYDKSILQVPQVARFRHALLLMLGSCLPVMATVLIAPVLPLIMQHFKTVPGHEILVPIALTTPALIVGIVGPFAGFLIDRFGRKPLVLAALALYTLFGCAPLFLQTLPAIIASRVGVGLAEAFIMVVCTTLVADYFDGTKRDRYIALQTVVASVSATVFFGIGGVLGESGWRTPFVLYALGLLLLPIFAVMLWEPAPSDRAAAGRGIHIPVRPFPWNKVLTIGAITFGSSIAFYLLPVHLGLLLSGLGDVSASSIGMAMALASAATVAGAFCAGLFAGRSVAFCLSIAYVSMGCGCLVVGISQSYPVMVAGAIVNGFGAGLVLPTLMTWLMRQLQFSERGRGSGVFMACFFLGHFICPLVVIGLATLGGGMAKAVQIVGYVLFVAGVLTLACLLPRFLTGGGKADA